MDPLIGKSLPGGFVILELIAVGGMGRVYRAEQTKLGRTVAVKIIHPSLVNEEKALVRFITEARTTSMLNHPNSVSIIDFGKTDDGQPYLVMEYLTGRHLGEVLVEDWPLPFQRIIDILRQVLAALSEAHHLGIIHRDLKPENIIVQPMRTGGDFVKVVDFGLARILSGSEQSRITAEGIVCGTPDFMAPEQGRGGDIDGRVDIYAGGVILYQLLTGRLPFEAESATDVVLKHITEAPIDPRDVAPSRAIPATLSMVTLSALAKDPSDRYQDAEAFSNALLAVSEQLTASNRPPASSQPPRSDDVRICPACQAPNPAQQRFCGQCGARISTSSRPSMQHPAMGSGADSHADASVVRAVQTSREHDFIGRSDLLENLAGHWAMAQQRLVVVQVRGGAGFGKTRLLEELANRIDASDPQIIRVRRDPWWAGVPLRGVRTIIEQATGLEQVHATLDSRHGLSQETLDGLRLIFGDQPPPNSSSSTCRKAIAGALLWAFELGLSERGPLLLALDDIEHIDGATKNAIWDVLPQLSHRSILLIATRVETAHLLFPVPNVEYELHPLSFLDATQLLAGNPFVDWLRHLPAEQLSPLYVQQLRRLSPDYPGEPLQNLADLIGFRVNMLGVRPRQVLQILALVGGSLTTQQIEQVAGEPIATEDALRQLEAARMTVRNEDGWQITHGLIREVAQESIPAEARRTLHEAVLGVAQELQLPHEARALHAFGAQDAFSALVLLDQVGTRAASFDDLETAARAFRRGVQLTRQEIYKGELDEPVEAFLMFSQKLADALNNLGDENGAEGILREAAAMAEPKGERTAQILYRLAAILIRRAQHMEEAARTVQKAITAARACGADDLLEDLQRWEREGS